MGNPQEEDNSVLMALAGDVMIGRLVNEFLDSSPSSVIWGNLLPILKNCDLNLINLEAALTTSSQQVPKVFNFKADPEKVQTLIDASITVVNLANNHILDYSTEGLLETLTTLDKAGIKHVGAGRNIAEASAPVIINRKGISIGFLGCTDNEPTWLASQAKPGVNYLEVGNINAIKGNIKLLRPQVDLLILSIHWGPNMREKPTKQFMQFAHELVDCGVDLIHGHSAHIFQGIEVYKNKLILYDTGDFVDDYAVDPFLRNDCSFLFLVDIDKSGIKTLNLIPVVIDSFQVNKALGEEAVWIEKRMIHLSKEMGTELAHTKEGLYLCLSEI